MDMNEAFMDIAPLFDEMELRLHNFNKDNYEKVFHDYLEENKLFFEGLNKTLADLGEEEYFIPDFADIVIGFVEKELENSKGKIKREDKQLSFNMFMAVYFMPAILEGKQARAQELTECICRKWAEKFTGNHIKSADYNTILSGFKSKLCYITTAVCKSLHKAEDCYELELLRKYRDGYLAQTQEGEALVSKYYDIAPTIVKRIDKSADAEEKYRYIWETYLKPCVFAIENGQMEECGKTYIKMVEELQEQYMKII